MDVDATLRRYGRYGQDEAARPLPHDKADTFVRKGCLSLFSESQNKRR
ncbi:hypothetical protein GCM10025859_10300 [Alicyclobacillus fastidiosus]|nr:hypothetical protein GCM10025859_10300 [Alicyclobacillus fastidiosus]